jgi:hypothetical protein
MGSISEGKDENKLILPTQYQGNTAQYRPPVRPKFSSGERWRDLELLSMT